MSAPAIAPAAGTQRAEIAGIVARESAETLVGQPGGVRVGALRRLLRPAAHIVAGRLVAYDELLGTHGPGHGALSIVARATGGIDVRDAALVPPAGPLLVAANHPGLADAVALLAAMRRDDAWVVAAEYPFLRALRRASRRFLFVPGARATRRTVLRAIVGRLRDGDAVLIFPAGGLEVDPALAPHDALRSIAAWSRSVGLVSRLVPGVAILPSLVRGAVSRDAFDHPLARSRRSVRERQRMATLLQLAFPRYQRGRVSVSFGRPIDPRGTDDVDGAVAAEMRTLLGAS